MSKFKRLFEEKVDERQKMNLLMGGDDDSGNYFRRRR